MSNQSIGDDVPDAEDPATTPGGPAHRLLGLILEGGWHVTSMRSSQPDDTGAYFSVGYFADQVDAQESPTGARAFVKALDYSKWEELNLRTSADAIQALTSAFLFERDIVEACTGRHMANVVRGIDSGSVVVPGFAQPFATVNYIVFEVADGGDVRAQLRSLDAFDEAWKLRVLHNVANGLRQLHQADFAHQDLKPSNVLCFGEIANGGSAKVGDLGRAHNPLSPGPHANAQVPGDAKYAPPELLYRQFEPDERLRCRAIDAYHLGSLITCLFCALGTTAGILSRLAPEFHFSVWTEDYSSVLPYVREVYDDHLDEVATFLPQHDTDKLMALIRELTDPDPAVRGNPKSGHHYTRFAMERYVSILNRLARDAEIRLKNNV